MDDLDQWTDLFVAVAGASAALAGLVTVAISGQYPGNLAVQMAAVTRCRHHRRSGLDSCRIDRRAYQSTKSYVVRVLRRSLLQR